MFQGMPPDPEKEAAMKKCLAILEQLLEKTTYVAANHLTIADYSLLATLVHMEKVSHPTRILMTFDCGDTSRQ